MESIIISLAENVLKVSLNGVGGLKITFTKVHDDIANGTQILDTQKFVELFLEQYSSITSPKQKKLPLTFIVEPEDIYLHFTTLNKQVEDIHEFIIADARNKLKEVAIEDTYFSYQKIAPFVYQFVAVKKDHLEKCIEVSNLAGFELKSVVPWIMLLPKLLTDNNPSIFVSKRNGHQILALSDLNGIYFSGIYEQENSAAELEKLVHELSVYRRNQPITRVFTIDYDKLNLGASYQVYSLPIPVNDPVDDQNFKLHYLYNSVIGQDHTLLETQLNFLNILPLPQVSPSKKPMLIKVGSTVTVLLLLIGGLVYYFGFYKGDQTNQNQAGDLAVETTNPPAVLSDDKVNESTESVAEEDSREVELLREDLSIRVENGAGIAGIAGSTQETLESLGYVVTGIGNFAGDTRENTLLKFKSSKAQYKELLTEDLKDEFELVVEEDLEESEEFDILIVIGTN